MVLAFHKHVLCQVLSRLGGVENRHIAPLENFRSSERRAWCQWPPLQGAELG